MLSPSLTIADLKRVDWLIESLPSGQDGLFNPWRDECSQDTETNNPVAKFNRLACHLACDPKLLLIGEAPGYQGCRYSGVAFTSERLLLEGVIPRIAPIHHRLSRRSRPFSEPSATIVWNTLYRLGLEKKTILWNALQLHPHQPQKIWTNRTPSKAEILLGRTSLLRLIELYPTAKIVAVGQKSRDLLVDVIKITPAATVRHPANGGATKFSNEIASFAASI